MVYYYHWLRGSLVSLFHHTNCVENILLLSRGNNAPRSFLDQLSQETRLTETLFSPFVSLYMCAYACDLTRRNILSQKTKWWTEKIRGRVSHKSTVSDKKRKGEHFLSKKKMEKLRKVYGFKFIHFMFLGFQNMTGRGPFSKRYFLLRTTPYIFHWHFFLWFASASYRFYLDFNLFMLQFFAFSEC